MTRMAITSDLVHKQLRDAFSNETKKDILTIRDTWNRHNDGSERWDNVNAINVNATNLTVTGKLTVPSSIFINVQDYGAVGDGTTDDTAAIQSAINVLQATGGIVYFPRKTYKVTSTLTVQPTTLLAANIGIRLFLDGAYLSTATSGDVIKFVQKPPSTPNQQFYCGIEGGYILPGTPFGGTSTGTAVRFIECQEIVLRDVQITGYALSISLEQVYSGQITNCGLSPQGVTNGTSIKMVAGSSTGDGVTTDMKIIGNRIGSTGTGYLIFGDDSLGNNTIHIKENYFGDGWSGKGIYQGGGNNWWIQNNFFGGNTGAFDVQLKANSNHVTGNQFASGNATRTILDLPSGVGTTLDFVHGNQFFAQGFNNITGINVATGAVVISSNTFRQFSGTGSSAIANSSTDAIVYGNETDESAGQFLAGTVLGAGDFNGVSADKKHVLAYTSNNTNVANDLGFVVRNEGTTTNGTTGLHLSGGSGGGPNSHPIFASIVGSRGAAVSNQYPAGTLHFLLAGTNSAPAEIMTLKNTGELDVGSIVPTTPVAVSNGGTGQSSLSAFVPTLQIFTSGSGTYTTPAGATWLRVRMVGGGGGGGGSGAGGTSGSNGNDTTFGSSFLTAGLGGGGNNSTGSGGSAGTASGGDINATGNPGEDAEAVGAGNAVSGSNGGASFFGGSGIGGFSGAAGGNGTIGGGGGSASTATVTQEGGGSGGYVEKFITSPSATYSYAVGAGGNGGSAGAGGFAGGNGGTGIIIVEEHYI